MITIPCPHCKAKIEARWFTAHLKACPRQKPAETEAQRDARMLAEFNDAREEPLFTSYEKSLLNRGDTKGAMAASQRRHEIAAKARRKAG